MTNSNTQNREEKKYKNLKREITELYLKKKRTQILEGTCVNSYRVTNEDTPENQVKWMNEEGKIYNSIFTFREDAPIEKQMADLCEKENNMRRI